MKKLLPFWGVLLAATLALLPGPARSDVYIEAYLGGVFGANASISPFSYTTSALFQNTPVTNHFSFSGNNFLGMVRQWQEFFFEKRYSAVNMKRPDFVKLAEAHGVPARLVTKREEVDEAIEWARKTEGPVVLEFRVEQEDAVYPMVPAGAALHEMIRRPVKSE